MAEVIADLTYLGQKLNPGLPFLGGETSFPGEVMEVGYDALEEIAESRIGALGIDDVDIVGNIFGGQILHGGDRRRGFAATHTGGCCRVDCWIVVVEGEGREEEMMQLCTPHSEHC